MFISPPNFYPYRQNSDKPGVNDFIMCFIFTFPNTIKQANRKINPLPAAINTLQTPYTHPAHPQP